MDAGGRAMQEPLPRTTK